MKQFSLANKSNILGPGRTILKKARETLKENMDKKNIIDNMKLSSDKLNTIKEKLKKNFRLS